MKFKKRYIFIGIILIFVIVLIINNIIVSNNNRNRANKPTEEYTLTDNKITKINKLDIVTYKDEEKSILSNILSVFQLMGCGNYKAPISKDTSFYETVYDLYNLGSASSIQEYDNKYVYNLYNGYLSVYDINSGNLIKEQNTKASGFFLYNDYIILFAYNSNYPVQIYKFNSNEFEKIREFESKNIIDIKVSNNKLVYIEKEELKDFNDFNNTYYSGVLNANYYYTVSVIDLSNYNVLKAIDINSSAITTKITDDNIYIASNNFYTNVNTYIDIFDYNLKPYSLRINGKLINSEAFIEDDNKLKVLTTDYSKDENYQTLTYYNLNDFTKINSKTLILDADSSKAYVKTSKFDGSKLYLYTSKLDQDNPIYEIDTTNIEDLKVSKALPKDNYYIFRHYFNLNSKTYYYQIVYDNNHLRGEFFDDNNTLITSIYYMDLDYLNDESNKYIIKGLKTSFFINPKYYTFNSESNALYITLLSANKNIATFKFDGTNVKLEKEKLEDDINSYLGLYLNNKQYIITKDKILFN